MKKTKVRQKPGIAKKPAKRAVKSRPAAASVRRSPVAREPAGMESLAEAIVTLADIAADLRQTADDLRDLMSGRGESELETLVVTHVENPEGSEEEP